MARPQVVTSWPFARIGRRRWRRLEKAEINGSSTDRTASRLAMLPRSWSPPRYEHPGHRPARGEGLTDPAKPSPRRSIDGPLACCYPLRSPDLDLAVPVRRVRCSMRCTMVPCLP